MGDCIEAPSDHILEGAGETRLSPKAHPLAINQQDQAGYLWVSPCNSRQRPEGLAFESLPNGKLWDACACPSASLLDAVIMQSHRPRK
jgi:hypothetical protein